MPLLHPVKLAVAAITITGAAACVDGSGTGGNASSSAARQLAASVGAAPGRYSLNELARLKYLKERDDRRGNRISSGLGR